MFVNHFIECTRNGKCGGMVHGHRQWLLVDGGPFASTSSYLSKHPKLITMVASTLRETLNSFAFFVH